MRRLGLALTTALGASVGAHKRAAFDGLVDQIRDPPLLSLVLRVPHVRLAAFNPALPGSTVVGTSTFEIGCLPLPVAFS